MQHAGYGWSIKTPILHTLPILLAIGLCHPTAVRASTFYVSPLGDDSQSGLTPEEAWQTVEKVNSMAFNPGDAVLFEGGRSFSGPLKFDVDDRGAAGDLITVGTYRLEEAGKATLFAGLGRGIDIYNTSGLRIADLNIIGAGISVNQASGVFIYTSLKEGASDIQIDNLDISGFGCHGISLGAWKTRTGYRNVSITHCTTHDNLRTGILTWGPWGPLIYAHSKVYVGHCRAFNMSGGSGIVFSSVNGGVIERSVAHNNGAAFSGAVGIWAWDSNDILIQFNESYDNRTTDVDGDGFDFDGGVTNSVMQYNYSHGNDAAGFLLAQYTGAPQAMRNNVIRYNISENDCRKKGYGAIHVWNGEGIERLEGAEIYNNTVYLSASRGKEEPSAINISTPTRSIAIRNNLLMTTGGKALVWVAPGQEKLLFQNNAYWPGDDPFQVHWQGADYKSLSAWLEAAPEQERHDGKILAIQENPMLTRPGTGGTLGKADLLSTLNAYRLKADSLMVSRGLDLQTFGINPGSHGFYGNPLPQAASPAIGAHVALETALHERATVDSGAGQSLKPDS